jgi:hypothetical protein
MMDNIENNKLITEFVGNIIRDNIVYFPMLQECKVDELEYDSSYDWLMSVIDFIEELGSYSVMGRKLYSTVKFSRNNVEIYFSPNQDLQLHLQFITGKVNKNTWRHTMYKHHIIKQFDFKTHGKQRGLYEAIVEFIKWYNKNECLCKNPTIQKNTKQCGKCKLYIDRVKHILLTQNNNHEK